MDITLFEYVAFKKTWLADEKLTVLGDHNDQHQHIPCFDSLSHVDVGRPENLNSFDHWTASHKALSMSSWLLQKHIGTIQVLFLPHRHSFCFIK